MSGETAECLGVGQHSGAGVAQDIALINANQCIQHGGILQQIFIGSQLVGFGSTFQELGKHLRAKCQRQNSTAHTGGGGITTADVVIHEESSEIVAALCQRGSLTGHSNHVMGGIQAGFHQSILHKGFVGQGFQGSAGLGNQDEQRMCQIQVAQHTGCVVGIHIGNKGSLHFQGMVDLCPVFQRQVDGTGAEVRAANTNLADSGELLTGSVGNLTGMNLVCKSRNLLLLAQVERTLVDTVGNHILAQLTTAQVMQHPTLFAGVDDLTVIKSGKFLGQLCLLGKCSQVGQNGIVHRSGTEIKVHTGSHGDGIALDPLSAIFASHRSSEIYFLIFLQLMERRQGIQIFPGNHC